MRYANVILPLPLEGLFTYAVPDTLLQRIRVGVRVVVPLGKSKTYTALVAELHDNAPEGVTVKNIIEVLDAEPMVLGSQLKLWQWIADYYMSPIGEVFKAALPSGLKVEDGYRPRTETCVGLSQAYHSPQSLQLAFDMLRRSDRQQKVLASYLSMKGYDGNNTDNEEIALSDTTITRDELINESRATPSVLKALVDKGILYMYTREVGRLNSGLPPCPDKLKPLNEAQSAAYESLLSQFTQKNVILLHGVTSSGKTEIYMHLIQKAIDQGKQVLYLLPEIALTVQIMQRLQRVFGNRMGIYHSKYSDAERVEIWQKQLSDSPYDIILGARSACLLPFQRLGLVIVDEEHETSFKQQDPAPRYHARSTAIMLAHHAGAKVLLGTATPSAESYYNATSGKYGLVTLTSRFKGIELPEIQVVDTKDLQRRKMMQGAFSPALITAIRHALHRNEQVILFQNRRGFAPMIECRVCGWVPHCEHCDVALTYHKNLNVLTCHYCGTVYRVPTSCPCCEESDLRSRGYGTEKLEDAVMELFPDARVARMDLDTARTRSAYERIIADFSSGKTNILIGTQMVSKGLDFDKVSVVGIISADGMLNYPDFRAYELAFMMMSQVAGRAGRKGHRGLVLLQTKSADLPVISQVVANDYQGFYQMLFEERKAFGYPPFTHLIYVFLKHRDDRMVEAAAQEMGRGLRQLFGSRVLGPDKPAIARVKQLNIRKIVLKLENNISMKQVREYLRSLQSQLVKNSRYGALQVYYDVDPL